MDDKTRKYIAKFVEDMHSLVAHGLQPVSHQIDEATGRGHHEAARVIRDFKSMLESHERVLQQRLDALGTSPTTAVQDAAASVAGFVAGPYNQVRTEAVAKSLRDDYTFASHCCVSWMMLMTTARSLDDHETEELAERGYRDVARLIMDIDHVLPMEVVTELQQDGFPAQDVTAWTNRIVSEGWRPEEAHQSAA